MFHSTQCVFIGYSAQHKGVKCLDVSTGRVYISRDVVFDETKFPFADLHPNAGALLRQEILLLPSHLTGDVIGGNSCGEPILTDSHNNMHELFGTTGENTEEIAAENEEHNAAPGSYFMCPPPGSRSTSGSLLQQSGGASSAGSTP